MILRYYGMRTTERHLAQLSGCTFEEGTTAEGLRTAADTFGCKTNIYTDGSIEDMRQWIEQEIPVIVHWFSTDTGHYSVVVNITDTHITLLDPDTGKHRRYTHDTWHHIWFGFKQTWIRSGNDLIVRRYIVVLPPSVS